jgi:hypothetical protein
MYNVLEIHEGKQEKGTLMGMLHKTGCVLFALNCGLEYAMTEPKALKSMPFILGKTLGKAMGSVHLAALWGMLQAAPKSFQENAAGPA